MITFREYKARDGSHIMICPFKKSNRAEHKGVIKTTSFDGQQKGDEYNLTLDLNDYILNIAGTEYELKLVKIGISEILDFDLMKGFSLHDSFTFIKNNISNFQTEELPIFQQLRMEAYEKDFTDRRQ